MDQISAYNLFVEFGKQLSVEQILYLMAYASALWHITNQVSCR